MKMFSKILVFLVVISLTLAILVLPASAQTSGDADLGTYGGKHTICNATFSFYGNEDAVTVAGNGTCDYTVYDDFDDIVDNAVLCQYLLTPYGQQYKGSVLSTYYANYPLSDQYVPHWDNQVMYYKLSASSTTSSDPRKPILSALSVQTNAIWTEFDAEFMPYIVIDSISSIVTSSTNYTFEVFVRDDGFYSLARYDFSYGPVTAEVPLPQRVSTRIASERAYEDLRAAVFNDYGYYPEYVRSSCYAEFSFNNTSADATWTSRLREIGVISRGVDVEDSVVFDGSYETVIEQVDVLSWLPYTVDRFLNTSVFGSITFGNLLLIVLAFPALLAVLRLLGGVG